MNEKSYKTQKQIGNKFSKMIMVTLKKMYKT